MYFTYLIREKIQKHGFLDATIICIDIDQFQHMSSALTAIKYVIRRLWRSLLDESIS